MSKVDPYYTDEHLTLYLGNFRTLLPRIVEEHGDPDLVLVDPPYGETALEWDRWPAGWPALMPGRSMWCFASMRTLLDRVGEFTSWKFGQDVVWEKHNGSSMRTDRFRRVHEHATHWYRGAWRDVYHQTPRVAVPPGSRPVSNGRRDGARAASGHFSGDQSGVGYVDDGTRLQRSVIKASSMQRRGAIHPTEKPPEVVADLIKYGCPPGGLVLDPMAGSCSSLAVARSLGCRAVGIELREEHCEKAVLHRLAKLGGKEAS